jgi:hypothetical protein
MPNIASLEFLQQLPGFFAQRPPGWRRDLVSV